jgi:hypothetical protein
MNRFERPSLKKRIQNSVSFPIILFIAILGVFLYGISSISDTARSEEKRNLENALQRDIIHCYTVEGIYPPTLEYMEDNYGLTYDSEKYIVDYQVIGSNLMPDFHIIERNPE